MKLKTKNFGELEVNSEDIITFTDGLPGFEKLKKFTLLSNDANKNFVWLQSIEDGDIALVLFDAGMVIPEYDPQISIDTIKELGKIENNLLVYNVVVIPSDIKEMTANLVAPIVINKESRIGKQIIVKNEEYSVKHKIFELIIN